MKGKKTIKWLLLPFLCAIIILSFILSSVSVKAENTLTPLKVGVPVDRCPVFYEDSDTKEIVGIGECGLDYYWDTSKKEMQKEVFKKK